MYQFMGAELTEIAKREMAERHRRAERFRIGQMLRRERKTGRR